MFDISIQIIIIVDIDCFTRTIPLFTISRKSEDQNGTCQIWTIDYNRSFVFDKDSTILLYFQTTSILRCNLV